MHLRVLGQSMIVLNSERAAKDLLEKRSASYSDRPTIYFFSRYTYLGITPTLLMNRIYAKLAGIKYSLSCLMEKGSYFKGE